MHWQTILLEFCAISLLWATPALSCVDLKLRRADILVDVRLDTIMRHAAAPPYEELLQIGVTHLGTQIDSRFLNDTVMANALRRWVSEVHANGLLTYASIREGNLALLLAVSGQALTLGFDEIEFDELLSSHSMPIKQVLGAIIDLRKAHPSLTITLTEYARDSIRNLFRMLSRIPNIRIAIDVYNNLTASFRSLQDPPSAERLGAWTLIVNDTNADSYNNLLTCDNYNQKAKDMICTCSRSTQRRVERKVEPGEICTDYTTLMLCKFPDSRRRILIVQSLPIFLKLLTES